MDFAEVMMGARRTGNPGEFFEDVIEHLYTGLLAPRSCAVDGGANLGRHTCPMARAVGPTGKVVAFEPIPAMRARITARLEREGIGNVDLRPQALGATEGSSTFHWVTTRPGWSGLLKRPDLPADKEPDVQLIDVEVSTLDTIFANRDRPVRFIKLDLEGAEYHAMVGGRKLIAADRPAIVFESGRQSSATSYGYSKDDLFGLFSALGYRQFDILGRPFEEANWTDVGIPWDFVAVAAGSADEAAVARLPAVTPGLLEAYQAKVASA